MFELRDYQVELAQKGVKILAELGLVYYVVECRVGKSLIALECARLFGAKSVLFLTKKKAISSVLGDYQKMLDEGMMHLFSDEDLYLDPPASEAERAYEQLKPGYRLTVTNNESLHKVDASLYDLVINDEHHRMGAYPKPSERTKQFKEMFGHLPQIWLSGTPNPESYSQLYHQFWVSTRSPFTEANFYKWAKTYVNVRQRVLPHATVNDYSDARIDEIAPIIEPYMIRFTQADAGFVSTINEEVLYVKPSALTLRLVERLKETSVIQGREHTISAPTAVSLQSKLHQLYSGTILFDPVEGQPRVAATLDTFKVDFIRDHFAGQKLVIFYKFAQERVALLDGLGDAATDDIDEFRKTDKSIVLQIVSGREGLMLAEADAIVFYNICFSALSYLQGRDRMTTMTRKESKIYWIFSVAGIEEKIYNCVINKLDYTVSMFKKDFGIRKKKSSPVLQEKSFAVR